MYLNDIYTVTANLAGVPGISVPCGLSSEGLPIGVQLLGPDWSEANLLQSGPRLPGCKPHLGAAAWCSPADFFTGISA